MQRRLQPVAWFLLLITVAIPAVAQVSPFAMASPSTGCNEHGGTQPSRPASFACCQAGHNTAVVQKAFSFDRWFTHTSLLTDCLRAASLVDPGVTVLPSPSTSPPLLFGLRI